MDPVTTGFPTVVVNSPHTLYVGEVFESVDQARQFAKAYAISHNFAVKNGFVKDKDQTLLLLCKCAKKPFNSRNLPMTKGSTSANGLTGINPLAYPENRPVTAEARETMFYLVQHSSASLTTIASGRI
ncbi:hypothetical protein V1523DRAFT_419542 [Lipomyces doorenjongii]